MKYLNETEDITILDETEATTLTENITKNDVWQRCFTEELVAIEVENLPILLDSIRLKNNFDASISDESIRECMENMQMGLKVPRSFGYENYPLGDTAWNTMLQRAGFQQATALSNLKDKASQKAMNASLKAQIINMGFKTFKNKSLILIRDEKIRAVLSGDESDYSPMNFNELVSELKNGLVQMFSNVSFAGFTANHSYFTSTYKMNDVYMEKNIESIFLRAGLKIDKITLAVKLTSSDVGYSGANIFPYIYYNGSFKAIGSPLSLTHKHFHTLADFRNNVNKLYSLFQNSAKNLEELQKENLSHPAGAFKRICKQLSFPKKRSCELAEEFELLYPNPKHIDLYYKIYELYDEMVDMGLSLNQQVNIEENLARLLSNFSSFDIPYDWD